MTVHCGLTFSEEPKKTASLLDEITVLVLTYNEAPNIRRTLDGLRWAHQVIVVDSFSLDGTCDIAREYKNVKVVQRHFDNHADQWNHGLERINSG